MTVVAGLTSLYISVVQAILRGESIATAPRRSRACAYRAPTKQSQSKQVAGRRNRRSTSASTSGRACTVTAVLLTPDSDSAVSAYIPPVWAGLSSLKTQFTSSS